MEPTQKAITTEQLRNRIDKRILAAAKDTEADIVTLKMRYADRITGKHGMVQQPIFLDVLEITSPMIYTLATGGMTETSEVERTGHFLLEDPEKRSVDVVQNQLGLLEVSSFLRLLAGEAKPFALVAMEWSHRLLVRYVANKYSVPLGLVDRCTGEEEDAEEGDPPAKVPEQTEDILTFLLVESQGMDFGLVKDEILHLRHLEWRWISGRHAWKPKQPTTDFLSLRDQLMAPRYASLPAATKLTVLRKWGRAFALASAPHYKEAQTHLLVDLHEQPFGNKVLDLLPPEDDKNVACDWRFPRPDLERPVGSPAFCDTFYEAARSLQGAWNVVYSLRSEGLLYPNGLVVVSGGAVLRALGVLPPDLPRSDLDIFVRPVLLGGCDYTKTAMDVAGCVQRHYRREDPLSSFNMWIRGGVVYIDVTFVPSGDGGASTNDMEDDSGGGGDGGDDSGDASEDGTGVGLAASSSRPKTTQQQQKQQHHIQIIACDHANPILGFDWDCCAVQFDGERFQTTYPGLVALLTREAGRFNQRDGPQIERALKMFDRGFAVPLFSLLEGDGLIRPSKYDKSGQKRKREEEVEPSQRAKLMDEAIKTPSFFEAVLSSARFAVDREAAGRSTACPERVTPMLLTVAHDVEELRKRINVLDVCGTGLQYVQGEGADAVPFVSAQVVNHCVRDVPNTPGNFMCEGHPVQVAFVFDTVRCTRRGATALEVRMDETRGQRIVNDMVKLDTLVKPADRLHGSTLTGYLGGAFKLDLGNLAEDAIVDGITSERISPGCLPAKFTGTVTIVRAGSTRTLIARIAVFPQKMRRKLQPD